MKSLPMNIYTLMTLVLLANPLFAQYGGGLVTYTISGNTGVGEVELKGFPSGVIRSDSMGYYTTQLRLGWKGRVIAIKEGYGFEPSFMDLGPIKENQMALDFTPTVKHYTITGRISSPHGRTAGRFGRISSRTYSGCSRWSL